MSVILYAEASNGLLTAVSQGWRVGELELQLNAEEASVGTSQIVIDDPDGTFYMRGLKPLYVVETEATADDYLGIIGVFWSWNRVFRRGPYRIGPGREVVIHVNDHNTLLTRRVQKGGDAERDAETDVERMEWLVNTAEVIGGFGDNGFTIEDTTYFDHVGPVNMDATDYTGQDSAGVANDALQDSGKNFYLFNKAASVVEPIRVAMWYGHSANSNFTSMHKISNDLDDVSPATIDHFATITPSLASNYVFAPSIDAELDRDPSRQITGAMVQYDGDYVYASAPLIEDTTTRRDMVFAGELVKTAGQALQRAEHYVEVLAEEDDAITCAVIVPGKLVNGFHQGHRVGVKFTHLPGYESDYVNMRIASRTVRQIPEGAGISDAYEIAMDLRAETPPGPALPESPDGDCVSDSPTATQTIVPNNGEISLSPGLVHYWQAGQAPPGVPTTGYDGLWGFAQYGSGGSTDFAGDCIENKLRFTVVGAGTLTIHTEVFAAARTMTMRLMHRDGVDEIIDQETTGIPLGSDIVVEVGTHSGGFCNHYIDVFDSGGGCGSKWGWSSADWVSSE